MNIPNQITLGRLVLAIVFFVLLSLYRPDHPAADRWILAAGFWLFLAAAIGDVVDGWLARAWQQVTPFGRVVDPVVDKIMVCGAFIFFCSTLFVTPGGGNRTGVAPWMVVLVLFRELFVSAIRSFVEVGGGTFAANWAGKIKMFVQSATVCVILGVLAWYETSLAWLRIACLWATVIVTTLSLVEYLRRVRSALLSSRALGGNPGRDEKPAELSHAARETRGASA